MSTEPLIQGFRTARADVERVCTLLISPTPEVLDQCPNWLQRAGEALANLRPGLGPAKGNPQALAEAQQLHAAVGRARRLLDNAADYHRRWNQIMGTMSAGYLPGGDAAPVYRPGRVCLRG